MNVSFALYKCNNCTSLEWNISEWRVESRLCENDNNGSHNMLGYKLQNGPKTWSASEREYLCVDKLCSAHPVFVNYSSSSSLLDWNGVVLTNTLGL